VIVKNYDEGQGGRPYGHALVCGLAKYPRKVRPQLGEVQDPRYCYVTSALAALALLIKIHTRSCFIRACYGLVVWSLCSQS
jgi:hypothetical protein